MCESLTRLALLAALAWPAWAQSATPGVTHPYVNLGERELEYGLVWRDLDRGDVTLQRASFGYAFRDDLAVELYLLSEFPAHEDARARAYEVEVRWQLTEQGEYASDWGLIFEAERGADRDRHEVAAGVLWEKELAHRWVAAANGLVEYEFGNDVENEFEATLRAQLRYLRHPAFEPALELYLDDMDRALGPAMLGMARLSAGRKLRWEGGLYFGLDRDTPATTLRAGIELEF